MSQRSVTLGFAVSQIGMMQDKQQEKKKTKKKQNRAVSGLLSPDSVPGISEQICETKTAFIAAV